MFLNKKNFELNSISLTNLVFGFFPISFILGNFIINANILLFCAMGIFHLRSKILKIKLNIPLKIIFSFFIAVIFSTSLSFIKSLYLEGYAGIGDVHEYDNLMRLIKSILFFRFFLMLIIIYLLVKNDILNFKIFFFSAAFSAIFVSLDIIYQYIFGFDIIGIKSNSPFNSGFFGEEYIAGGFIQNFSFFSILFITLFLKNNNSFRFALTVIAISVLGLGIMLSGNRMPLILFLFGLSIVFLFDIKLKAIILTSLISLFILFKFIAAHDERVKNWHLSYFANIQSIVANILIRTIKEPQKIPEEKQDAVETDDDEKLLSWKHAMKGRYQNTHIRIFLAALDVWKKNKIFGNGIKSFRIDCPKLEGPEYNLEEDVQLGKKNRLCSGHPHNYYFEILTDLGIVGVVITLVIASSFIFFIFKNLKNFKVSKPANLILFASIICLILEMFPFKSTGSIFSTNNMSYIILVGSIIISYKKILNISDTQ